MLYRRDISLMGGGINATSKRKSGILKDIYNAELYLNNKIIVCVVSFYKFFGAYRIDLINNKNDEKDVYDYYFEFLKERPRFLFEYTLRSLLTVIIWFSMALCPVFSFLYNNLRFILVFILLYFLNYFISLV